MEWGIYGGEYVEDPALRSPFVTALIKARKEYELLAFPDERHLPRGVADRVYMEQRVMSFIERSL